MTRLLECVDKSTPPRRRLLPLAAVVVFMGVSFRAKSEDLLSFNRDVRPMLSDNCFHCHGPDKQRSRLRLDVSEIAVDKGAIVPRKLEESNLVKRTTAKDDPEFRMPPPDSNRSLTDEQIATLLRLLGVDRERLTHKFQGRRFRLTDVHGKVVEDMLA